MMNQLYERLYILQSSGTITQEAHRICHLTIKKFVNEQNADDYDILITHLAMAVTRIECRDPLYSPPEVIMNDVYKSPHLSQAKSNVLWIERRLKVVLPIEEKKFLLMHFVNILSRL